jgi:hypothetical protein
MGPECCTGRCRRRQVREFLNHVRRTRQRRYVGCRALQSPEFFLDLGPARLLIGKHYRVSGHQIGKRAIQRRCVAASKAQPVDAGGSVTVDSYEEAFERQRSPQPASSISVANILFTFVAIEGFAYDGLDRGHFSIRQLGKLALATLAAECAFVQADEPDQILRHPVRHLDRVH